MLEFLIASAGKYGLDEERINRGFLLDLFCVSQQGSRVIEIDIDVGI